MIVASSENVSRRVALCYGRNLLVAAGTGLLLFAPAWTSTKEVVSINACPRPTDQYGPRYETLSGAYLSRGVSPGGGKFVTIMPRDGAASVSVSTTERIFRSAGSLIIGTPITLVSYVKESLSGQHPPYSCIELMR